ncbi:hypothetical protein [Mucilaginibacter gotjawali]|uniref:Uncharacterized protein n=2 Tax=Mucilaginibacter gotjawali TaxID=1550579 RepID=A0A0X8X532_9SPHI|nr:hypothetical protein [Mucilaginibacter gotjawali]MBB3059015.1 hypothetical protein [Mucilaginibacter gotjawali]BAU55804.1 hypothetical protein MgSA37_03996 [Mucilaginibacter gotjawali]
MVIENANKDKITITIPSSIDRFGLQRIIDYLKYLELTSKSKATQADADKLAEETNSSWWEANKSRFNK